MGEFHMLGSQVEDAERTKAFGYLKRIISQTMEGLDSWRCEVVVSASVADGIADFARREEVDLIAMYTHDRKGLAKLIKGSIAEKVQKSATTQVQVFGPRELVAI